MLQGPDNQPRTMSNNSDDRNSATALTAALNDGKKHLLLAATGSVAVIKLPLIISSLAHYPNLSIRVILTQNAARFLTGQSHEQPTVASLSALPNVDAVYQDEHEWVEPWKRGADILHIQLRRWGHLLVVAPLSANTLAKVAGGFSDNLLTSVIRAWDTSPTNLKRPRIIVAVAMNSAMWTHPITAKQLRVLEEEWGVNGVNPDEGWIEVLRPQVKTLACGDFGQGGMCDWQEIVAVIEKRLCLKSEDS
jgi:phosphopantothenoylcysteine decarboxylase